MSFPFLALTITVPITLFCQDVPGVDYSDNASIMAQIAESWWLEHETCKYMLTIFVHKDNKDISSNPTALPAGGTREELRENKQHELREERKAGKAERPVEKYGDVDHQIKKARVDGMRSQAEDIKVKTIIAQINVLRKNEAIYKSMMGAAKYQEKMVQLMNQMPGMGETEMPGMGETEMAVDLSQLPNEDDEDIESVLGSD